MKKKNPIILGKDGHGLPPKGIPSFRLAKEPIEPMEEIILGKDGHGYPPIELSGTSAESHTDSSSDDV